ncbi:type III secretion system protein [Burkholderia ambifaria]|uniref:Type III secretion system protein n=1 Tax=Burkholderia ambifaria TaxID=152480 RepID=A0AA41E966_9BURK|nr:type III secretion system protein [Burkholderia ambifaria]MBR8130773.1 type III secretion system protein [Burkholderia ambifaria]PRD96951.1 type III secretion system protein [Burkholderia ambifaria]
MYQDLEAVRDDLKQLERTLQSRDGTSRIEQAFEACATRVSEATGACSGVQDRAALQKIYRGMIAARSIVRQLRELPNDGHSSFH